MIVVVTRDELAVREINETADASGLISVQAVCADLAAFQNRLDDGMPEIVLVDIDEHQAATLAELSQIIDHSDYTRFVVMATDQGQDRMLAAMEAGARHFLRKDAIGTELLPLVERIGPPQPSRSVSGQCVATVLSAGGGCGATTFAVGLATELQQRGDGPALLVDLDEHYGAIAGFLGLKPQFGIADVLTDESRIDGHLVRSTALQYNDRLHVLASPATISFSRPATMHFDRLARALRAARQEYHFSVVDAPRVRPDVAAELARASDMTFIVLEPNVEDVRVARMIVSSLTERGVPSSRMHAVVSRWKSRGRTLGWSEASKALDPLSVSILANDHAAAVKSLTYAKPLTEVAPRSKIRRDIRNVAAAVHEAVVNRTPMKASS